MTLEQAKNLKRGQIVYDNLYVDAKGNSMKWKVNGKVRTWKRSPELVIVPIKYGLYEYGHVTEWNLDNYRVEEVE